MSLVIPPNTRAVGTPDPAGDMDNVADVLGLLTQALARIAGLPGSSPPAGNAANITAVQTLLAGAGADIGLQPSGDTTGATDTANINALFGATPGAVALLGAGTFYLKSDVLMQADGQQLHGTGVNSTYIYPVNSGAAFTTAMISVTASHCGISGITFHGISSTVATNTVVSAIVVTVSTGERGYLTNIEGWYLNGWLVDLESTGGGLNMVGVRAHNTAGGVKLEGNGHSIGVLMTNCDSAQVGAGTGAMANLDGLRIHNAFDVTGNNLNFSVANDTSTGGHGFHLLGHVSNVWLSVIDCGGFSFPTGGDGQAGIMIEDDVTGRATTVHIAHGVFQTWDIGVRVKGPTSSDIHFEDCIFANNQSHGAEVDSTFSGGVTFDHCQFGTSQGSNGQAVTSFSYTATSASPAVFTATGSAFVNGTPVQLGAAGIPAGFSAGTTYYVVSASGTAFSLAATAGGAAVNSTSTGTGTVYAVLYDLRWTTSVVGRVADCDFGSPIVAVGSAGVQQSVAMPSGNSTQVTYPKFTGTSASASNWFTSKPANLVMPLAAAARFAPAGPAATTSATKVMMGLGSTIAYTPAVTGKVRIQITAGGFTATANVNFGVGGRYGTGTAPTNGTADTGTAFGASSDLTLRGVAQSVASIFTFEDIVSLTAGTAYWFDLAVLTSATADAATIVNVSATAQELQS